MRRLYWVFLLLVSTTEMVMMDQPPAATEAGQPPTSTEGVQHFLPFPIRPPTPPEYVPQTYSKSDYAPSPFDTLTLQEQIKSLKDKIDELTRQLMLQEWYREERIRSDGCSGIKQVRHQRDGTRPYHTETHIGSGVASIHDHADSVATMGMGEFHVVLNGVEFRTRHNDYLLKMPVHANLKYEATKDVPFPDVPQTVLDQPTISGQIREMREYFRAFKMQDSSIRDYKKYFKPVISYLEGTWIYTGKDLEEPFPGERHWIEAKTWIELEDKARFTGYAGTKEALENLAFLPRSIIGLKNGSEPVIAQWNYRILCHPLKQDLPTNRLHVVDDIATRMVTLKSLEEIKDTREARFRLSPTDSSQWAHGRYIGTLLDDLMGEVPGKDNYDAYLNDEAFGKLAYHPKTDLPLNTAYYHHLYKYKTKDGMGLQIRHRGFSDETLFMAMTQQPKVAGMSFDNCMHEWKDYGGCKNYTQKWTYAIPMEIIYLTPLRNWNPYDITYHGWSSDDAAAGVTRSGQRDGTHNRPFDGTDSKHFYRTPYQFYADEEYSVRPADTTGSDVFVLDSKGRKRRVRASGHRTFIPNIAGVGRVRQRYPIMPVHGEGMSVWKELDALKDIVLDPAENMHMFYSEATGAEGGREKTFYAKVRMSPALPEHGRHTHEIELTENDHQLLIDGEAVEKTSSTDNGHQHRTLLGMERLRSGYRMIILACDYAYECWDGHPREFDQGFTQDGKFVNDLRNMPETSGKEASNSSAQTTNQAVEHSGSMPMVFFVVAVVTSSFMFL